MKIVKHIIYWIYVFFYVYFFGEVVNGLARFSYNNVVDSYYGDYDLASFSIFKGDKVTMIGREGTFLALLTVALVIYSVYYWTPMLFRRKK